MGWFLGRLAVLKISDGATFDGNFHVFIGKVSSPRDLSIMTLLKTGVFPTTTAFVRQSTGKLNATEILTS